MLHLEGVAKSYDDTPVLRGLDLHVEAGEICALLGPNGAGKTTCVSIIAGLRRPDAGTVLVDGIDAVARPDLARTRLGLAPQDLGLYPMSTVRDNLRVFGGIAGLRRRALRRGIDEVAQGLDLTRLLDRRAADLSGGQKRRVHTAIALLHRPPVLLLDEPTVGADVETRQRLLATVADLARDGAAVCYTSHYLSEIEALDATVAVLDGGVIAARGTIAELTQRHAPGMVELTFDGPPPDVPVLARAVREGSVVRLPAPQPAVAAAEVIAALGSDAARLRNVELLRPGLESAYLALTGGRAPAPEAVDVAAS